MLWHLKAESELSHLAQEAVAWDRRSPHAWAIMGNCLSLQKVPFLSWVVLYRCRKACCPMPERLRVSALSCER